MMKNKIIAYKFLVRQLEEELDFHYTNLGKTDDIGAKAKIFTKIDLLEHEIDSILNDILRWEGNL